MNKKLTYGYDSDGLTHQPRVVYDTVASKSYNLYWDLNGNLQEISNCKFENVRFHSWDVKRLSRTEKSPVDSSRSKCGARVCLGKHRTQHVRLRAVIGPKQAGLYGYDGNGERVWKLTGTCQINSQNWGELSYSTFLDNAVLYPNPYLTITPSGYTKHYYLGTERIATALGEGGWNYVQRTLSEDEVRINKAYFEHFERIPCEKFRRTKNEDLKPDALEELQYSCEAECLSHVGIATPYDLLWACINNYQQPSGHHENLLFTHNDHLGSASWITDEGAHPIQYIHYAPYGELLASQKATGSSYDERYKFTGKERDAESGYDNFGARYYYPPLGIWTRPDPLLDKYIFYTPYMYCEGNPIVLRDPDGRLPQAVVGAVIGAAICGGIAIYNNKSWSEVGSAALGGAVAGAITAVTAGLASGGLASAIKLGMIGGAIGSAAGNSTEQGVNMAIGNQKGFDVQELGVSFVWGYGLGAVEGAGQYFIKSGANQLKVGVNAKYQSSSYKKFIRKEVIMEEKAAGNAYSKKTINSKMTNRINDLKDLDNYMIETTDKTIEKGVIPATSNIIEDELR